MELLKNIIKTKKSLLFISQHQKITRIDISLFLRQFATLISAGMPIIQSLTILEKTQKKLILRRLLYTIKQELLAGKSLFISLQRHSTYFDKLTCQLVKIGEHTGKLDAILLTIAQHHEKNVAFIKHIKHALLYPMIITITALIVTFFLLIFVVPKFADLFQEVDQQLPFLTICIFYLSAKLRQYFFLIVTIILLSIFIVAKQKQLQRLSTLPFINRFIQKITTAKFVRNLAITLASGLPIMNALKLSASISSNNDFINMTSKLINKVGAGISLNHALEEFTYFPSFMTQMIKIGEESGKLEVMLQKIADLLETEVEEQLNQFNQLLEPLIMLVLGVLIGGLVIGMYLPLFKLGTRL